ncbi:MAG: endonuclease III domain-containing protein [Gammaproteobacteria bacterium]|jgi:endonuclease-3 related protein
MKSAGLFSVYRRLLKAYGPQHWWPASDAFEIMVGAVLTQNTSWRNVERAIANLKRAELCTPAGIATAGPDELARHLRPSGYFNIKARRLQVFTRWYLGQGGYERLARYPTLELRRALLSVHGIGPETADDMMLYAFERPVFVVDAYTRRIFSRLGYVEEHIGYEPLRHRFEAELKPEVSVWNEYHALIVRHGKDICRPRPRCEACTLRRGCRYPDAILER